MKLSLTAWLGVGLAASLLLNAGMLYGLGVVTTRAGMSKEVALRDRRIEQLQGTIKVNAALAEAGAEDHNDLIADLKAIAGKAGAERTVYRDRISQLPPLEVVCAPGEDRMAAINALIGGTP